MQQNPSHTYFYFHERSYQTVKAISLECSCVSVQVVTMSVT